VSLGAVGRFIQRVKVWEGAMVMMLEPKPIFGYPIRELNGIERSKKLQEKGNTGMYMFCVLRDPKSYEKKEIQGYICFVYAPAW
jgi:hypothetical protein